MGLGLVVSIPFNRFLLLSATALSASLVLGGNAMAGEVAGRVTVDGGVQALAGAEVEIVELGRKAATQADGSFRFADVTSGTYTLRTSYSAGQEQRQPITVPATGTVVADILYGTGDQMAELVVVGQRANMASAISRQRSADGIQGVVTRDKRGPVPRPERRRSCPPPVRRQCAERSGRGPFHCRARPGPEPERRFHQRCAHAGPGGRYTRRGTGCDPDRTGGIH
jgi:hypothetical protein